MKISFHRDFLVRALHDSDPAMLDAVAAHLADCEQAKQILVAKGYADAGATMTAIARGVGTGQVRGTPMASELHAAAVSLAWWLAAHRAGKAINRRGRRALRLSRWLQRRA